MVGIVVYHCAQVWTIRKRVYIAELEAIAAAKQEIVTDTFIKRDTIEIEIKSKPIFVEVIKDRPINIADFDSLQLSEIVNLYFAKHIYKDEPDMSSKGVYLMITDTISENNVIARKIDLQIIRTDTVFTTIINHIVEPVVINVPKNNIDIGYGIGEQSIDVYSASYMRQFGKGKIQYRIGVEAGMFKLKPVNDKLLYGQFKAGIAF